MFTDKKLNQCFNDNNKQGFVSRVLDLCKKSKFEKIKVHQSPVMDDSIEFAVECLNDHIEKRMGKIYVAINELHQDRIKIGRTSKDIEERERSLNSAGVSGKIKIVWFDVSLDSVMTETFIHQRIKESHIEKEFFNIDVVSASQIISECTDLTYDFYKKIKNTIYEYN